jgi:hypothetical protein
MNASLGSGRSELSLRAATIRLYFSIVMLSFIVVLAVRLPYLSMYLSPERYITAQRTVMIHQKLAEPGGLLGGLSYFVQMTDGRTMAVDRAIYMRLERGSNACITTRQYLWASEEYVVANGCPAGR